MDAPPENPSEHVPVTAVRAAVEAELRVAVHDLLQLLNTIGIRIELARSSLLDEDRASAEALEALEIVRQNLQALPGATDELRRRVVEGVVRTLSERAAPQGD